jgi:hypothetical protein
MSVTSLPPVLHDERQVWLHPARRFPPLHFKSSSIVFQSLRPHGTSPSFQPSWFASLMFGTE